MKMRIAIKTRWLIPILMVGLFILALEPPTLASNQAPADAMPAPEATPAGLEPAMAEAETTEATQAEFDDTTCGTY